MTIFNRVQELAKNKGKNLKQVALDMGFGENYFYTLKKQSPKAETLEVIADYFNVSADYLLGRTEEKEVKPYYALTEKDERDIAKRLESVMDSLDSESSLAFHGGEMDEETREMLKMALEHGMKIATETAKRKYTPKKYRK